MSIRQVSGRLWRPAAAWRVIQVLTVALLAAAAWRYLWLAPYRIDIDVYRMGGRAWLNASPLYSDGTLFTTKVGLGLPFTYPPMAAVVFAPFAWLPMAAASATITVITFVLLLTSTFIVLTRLDVWEHSSTVSGPAWRRRSWLAVAIVAPALLALEPIRSNFDFGQINVIVMTLVIADLVPRRTPWPRGLLLGLAIALKLTPAVFLLYLLLRRDTRALLTTTASLVVTTAFGFALAWRDSWEYWTTTIRHTDRIGGAAYRTNQNVAGTLARLDLGETPRFVIWVAASVLVLALTVWTVRRLLRSAGPGGIDAAEQPVLALICVAMFGLVVSPVSWSHHWVWCLPAIVVTAVIGYRYRNVASCTVAGVGVALMVSAPFNLMGGGDNREMSAPLWRQLIGCSYLWWALALIVVAGTVTWRPRNDAHQAVDTAPAHARS